jgi:predicted nucleotidyltransferase
MRDAESIALRDFHAVVENMGLSCLIVGAGARLLIFDWKYQIPTLRNTTDWDFAVRVEKWNDYNNLIAELCSGEKPLFQRDRSEQRCIHVATKIELDIVPFGAIGKPEDVIQWPKSENQMNVMGFEEAFMNAEAYEIDGVTFKVVSVPAFIALKLLAWQDRYADKDLKDIDYILTYYLNENTEQIYSDLDKRLTEGELEHIDTGFYHLGWKIKSIFPTQTQARLVSIIQQLIEGQKPYIPKLLESSAEDYDDRFDATVNKFEWLLRGIQSSS